MNSARRADCRGAQRARALFVEATSSRSCRCSAVIVNKPSFSFLIWVKVAIAPMNRLRLKKQPTKIHATKYSELADMSFRCGASPGPRESIPTNMTSSQPSPVAITNSVSIVAPNESNENGSSFRHSNASPTSVSSASDELPPPRRNRPCGVTSPSSARRAP